MYIVHSIVESLGMASCITSLSFVLFAAVAFNGVESKIRFASSYGNHMVLQRGPARAVLWGFADVIGDTVTVVMNGVTVGQTTVYRNVTGSHGVWKLKLPAETSPGPYSITTRSSEGEATLHDVMFGDVWVCSGQSNMQFKMKELINSDLEVNDALKYPNIRTLMAKLTPSSIPLDDVQVSQPWLKPMKGFIENFSAVCFLYAKALYPHLNYPIGLIETNWGGTPIEVWSSPSAISSCPKSPAPGASLYWPTAPSSLWNAMVHPFLNTTIYGAIWYQGESNAGHPSAYACQFPAMIADWRKQFHAGSDGETSDQFPFGFVQLAPWRQTSAVGGFPALRWAQTADVGYVPNSKMPNTFMSVAIDLPDYHSTSGSIHPRYKQDVAERLALAGRAVAYHEGALHYQGPFPTDFTLDSTIHALTIVFDHGTANLRLQSNDGFEVCCSHVATCTGSVTWVPAKVASHTTATVYLDVSICPAGTKPVSVRYLWKESPCALKQCPIYSKASGLPAPPFTRTGFR